MTLLKSGWWLGVLGAGLLQMEAAAGPLSVGILKVPASGLNVRLGWVPSPSTNATGYFLNWGLVSGQCTNQLDVGNVTNTTVSGLDAATTYYFNVVTYDTTGDESVPSNELVYTPPPTLSLQSHASGTNDATMGLSFPASAGRTYVIEATEDFQQWTTLWTTNCTISGLMVYATVDPASYAKRFYRVGLQ